jgi:hypothetical protein
MIRILLLTLSLLFTQELEVQGDLKVSGSIDAQNNPIKNVGIPQELTDAINGNVLQDALRDDANHEYKFVGVHIDFNQQGNGEYISYSKYYVFDDGSLGPNYNFAQYLNQLSLEGWSVDQTILYSNNYIHMLCLLKRPILEVE